MRIKAVSALRSLLAVILGYVVIAAGTVLTFNVLVGQVTVQSPLPQLVWGTIGAAISGLAGGIAAGLISPRAPVLHALGTWSLLALDTTFVVIQGWGPIWFDIAGSSVLAICALAGGFVVAHIGRGTLQSRQA